MSKEMNIEEAIESLNKFIKIVDSKEYRDDNGWNGYYNTEMRYLGQAIETVLADRENLINRNKELEEMLQHRIKYTNELEKDLFENASNYVVPKSVIKEKMEEIKNSNENYTFEKLTSRDIRRRRKSKWKYIFVEIVIIVRIVMKNGMIVFYIVYVAIYE